MVPPRADRSGRRTRLTVGAAVAVVIGIAAGAPVSTAAEVPAPKTLCTVDDPRLPELSGLASNGRELFAVNDGGTQVEVMVLDRECTVQRTITASIDPYDVEDLALDANGVLWLSDTGDNGKARETVALIAVRPDGSASLHRLTYPDGQHDAEALLLDRRGTPYVVTKSVLGRSAVYRPAERLRTPGPTPLEKVATVSFAVTGTPGGPDQVGPIGSMLVTGGAVSRDGTVVALRTYTDAYLFPAPDGNVVAALKREPVRVPLPGEPQGEAIAFDPDGTLLAAGEGVGQPIRAVRKAAALVDAATSTQDGSSSGKAGNSDAPSESSSGDQQRSRLPALVVATLTAVVLWFGLGKLRRRRR